MSKTRSIRIIFKTFADVLHRRGEIYERLGEPDKAALHYNRFLTLWDSADPELRPMVEYVEERLAELSSETLGD